MSQRKRNRVSLSCTNCRKRKAKCDRGRPFCGRCIVDKSTHNCEYEDDLEVHKVAAIPESMENSLLKNRIKELEGIVEHQQSLLETFSVSSTSPDSDKSNSMFDHANNRSGVYLNDTKGKQETESYPQSFDGFGVIQSHLFYQGSTTSVSNVLEDSDTAVLLTSFLNKLEPVAGTSLPSCYREPDKIEESKIPQLGTFPCIKDIDLLFNEMFTLLYPFILFFDKQVLLSQIHHLLDDKGTHSVINSSKSNQSSLIAIFLILLRLSFLLKKWNSLDTNIFVNETYVDIAQGILMSPSSFQNVALEKLQGLLLLRVYKMFCPEEDDTLNSCTILNACMVQSSRILGIHRHPSKYPKAYANLEKTWQKIWIHVEYFDSISGYDRGTSPLIHNSEIYLPTTVLDTPKVDNIFYLMNESSLHIIKFLEGEIKDRVVNKFQVLETVDKISQISSSRTLSFKQLMSENEMVSFWDGANKLSIGERAKQFEVKLNLESKQFSLYYLLYLNLVDTNEKVKYLSLAFERALILLQITVDWLKSPPLFGQISQLITPRIWIGPRAAISCFFTVILKAMDNKVSLWDMLKYFNTIEATDLISWSGINQDHTSSNRAILDRFIEAYSKTSSYASQYYSAHKFCFFFKLVLDHVKWKHHDFWINQCLPDDFNWGNEVDFAKIFGFWGKKIDDANLFNVESLFSGFNTNPEFLEFDWTESLDPALS